MNDHVPIRLYNTSALSSRGETNLGSCDVCGSEAWADVSVPRIQAELSSRKQGVVFCTACRGHWMSMYTSLVDILYTKSHQYIPSDISQVLEITGNINNINVSVTLPCPSCNASLLRPYIPNTSHLFAIDPATQTFNSVESTKRATTEEIVSQCIYPKVMSSPLKFQLQAGIVCDVCNHHMHGKELHRLLIVYKQAKDISAKLIKSSRTFGVEIESTNLTYLQVTYALFLYSLYYKDYDPRPELLCSLMPYVTKHQASKVVILLRQGLPLMGAL